MALSVIVVIRVENQAYESGINTGLALEEKGFASVAPGSFSTSGRGTIDMLIESAVKNALKTINNKLDIIQPYKENK